MSIEIFQSFDEIKTQLFVSHLNQIDITLFMIICWWITIKWLFSLWFGLKKNKLFLFILYLLLPLYRLHLQILFHAFTATIKWIKSFSFFHSLFYLLPLSSLLFFSLCFPFLSLLYYAQFFIHSSVMCCASERGVWLRSF